MLFSMYVYHIETNKKLLYLLIYDSNTTSSRIRSFAADNRCTLHGNNIRIFTTLAQVGGFAEETM